MQQDMFSLEDAGFVKNGHTEEPGCEQVQRTRDGVSWDDAKVFCAWLTAASTSGLIQQSDLRCQRTLNGALHGIAREDGGPC